MSLLQGCCDGCQDNKDNIFFSKNKKISVNDPFFSVYKGAKNGAAYCVIKNIDKTENDSLISAKYLQDDIKTIELHTHILGDDGVAKMRKVENIDVPFDKTTTLEPGHDHIMLINIEPSLYEKKKITLVLTFKSAGKIKVDFERKQTSKSCCGHDKP